MFASLAILTNTSKAKLSQPSEFKSWGRRGQCLDLLVGVTTLILGILASQQIGIPAEYANLTMGLGASYIVATLFFLCTSKATKINPHAGSQKRLEKEELKEKTDILKTGFKVICCGVFLLALFGCITNYIPSDTTWILLGTGTGSVAVILLPFLAEHYIREKINV